MPLAGGRCLELGQRTLVMAVINVTPDSFAETDASIDPARALDRALQAEAEGADLLDLGAESTRPASEPVSADEELRRLLPALRAIAPRVALPISIDTWKAGVARAALDEGAAIVNDISGLRYDPGLGGVVASAGAGLVVMHMRGTPRDMYSQAQYADVAGEVAAELAASVRRATDAGVAPEAILVDPGIGFAKKAEQSFELLARLSELTVLGRPVLVGTSRKSFHQLAIGQTPAASRDVATAATVTAAVLGGAHVVRVHAVADMVQVVRVADALRRYGRI